MTRTRAKKHRPRKQPRRKPRPTEPPPPLVDQVRGWVKQHPEAAENSISVAFNRSWDSSLEYLTREVETLRRRFPLERVREARQVLGMDGSRNRRWIGFEKDLVEQTYRAHYSSLKIGWSWGKAALGALALGRLFGVPDVEGDVGPWGRTANLDRLRGVLTTLWPGEGLEDLLAHLTDEDFYGHIPLRTGVIALGMRLVLHEYAWRVVGVLRRLHRDDAYTYGLCIGRVLSWDEAMVFKTLPQPEPRPEAGAPRAEG